MATLNSKISKAIFAVVASFVVNLAWQNVWRITSLLDIPSQTVLNSSIRDLLMALSVFIVLSIVVKPQKECLFLGLESNFAKGFLVAIISVLPIYRISYYWNNKSRFNIFVACKEEPSTGIHRGTFMPCLYVWIIFPICKNRLFLGYTIPCSFIWSCSYLSGA